MMGFLTRAGSGLMQYFENGKWTVLLLAILLVYFFVDQANGKSKELVISAAILSGFCILPPTAAILLIYQTGFYEYPYVWNIVPQIAAIACGGTVLYGIFKEKTIAAPYRRWLVCGAVVLVAVLCGPFGNPKRSLPDLKEIRQETAMLLDACQGADGEEICLWAPQEIMAQARSVKGNIRLVYGRNMWQENVNAFSYETYSDDQKMIYIWMVAVGNYGDLDMPDARDVILYGAYPDTGDMIDGKRCIHTALGLGVNRIILPGGIKEATLHQIEEITQATAERIGNYYLLRL